MAHPDDLEVLPYETYLEAAERLLKERVEGSPLGRSWSDAELLRRIYVLIRASNGHLPE